MAATGGPFKKGSQSDQQDSTLYFSAPRLEQPARRSREEGDITIYDLEPQRGDL